MDSGEIRPVPVAALASVLSAAFDRAALDIAEGASPDDIIAAIDALLDGFAPERAVADQLRGFRFSGS